MLKARSIGLFVLIMLSAQIAAAAPAYCRILYLDAATGHLNMLDPQTGIKQRINAGSSAIRYVLPSPDGKLLAVALLDAGQIVEGQRVGTQIFDVTAGTPQLLATYMLHFPAVWTHDSERLLLRRTITAAGLFQTFEVTRRALIPLRQTAPLLPESPFANGRVFIFLNVAAVQWSPDDRVLALLANEQPFPQDSNGVNYGIYALTDDALAVSLSNRAAIGDLIGWLADGRLLFEECYTDSCVWIAVKPDRTGKSTIRPPFVERHYVYNRLDPAGKFVVVLTSVPDGPARVALNLLSVVTGGLRKVDEFADVIPPMITWSPDGRYAAYSVPADDGNSFVPTVLDVQTGIVDRLSSLRVSADHVGSWSTDASQLIITGIQQDRNQLFIYQADARSVLPVSHLTAGEADTAFGASWICSASMR